MALLKPTFPRLILKHSWQNNSDIKGIKIEDKNVIYVTKFCELHHYYTVYSSPLNVHSSPENVRSSKYRQGTTSPVPGTNQRRDTPLGSAGAIFAMAYTEY
jgi:hypothetical protein